MKTLKKVSRFNATPCLLVVLFIVCSCASISHFDQYAYTQTTSLKVDALNIIVLAETTPYDSCVEKIQNLGTNLQKAYEYEKNRPKNEISIKLWEKLLNKDGHLLGGYFERWKKEGKVNSVVVSESIESIGEAFDQISGLESNKIKVSSVNL